jgi:outer membrane protein assembly factor BamA
MISLRAVQALFFFLWAVHAADDTHISLSDTNYTYRIDSLSLKKPTIADYTRRLSRTASAGTLIARYLDSLGYFSIQWDTLSPESIVVRPGSRYQIDTILIQCTDSTLLDSLRQPRFPRFYDAGEVDRFARQILARCGECGYPFATLSVNLDTAHDPSAPPRTPPRATAGFHVMLDKRAIFAAPLFLGKLSTRHSQISRDMTFRAGQLFDLRMVRATENRLAGRRYIAQAIAGAPVLCAPDTALLTSDTVARPVAVPFLIVDRSGMGLDGALAYNNDPNTLSPFTGTITLTLLNILGLGESAEFFYRGERSYQQMSLDAEKTHLLGAQLTVGGGIGLEIQQTHFGLLQGNVKVLTDVKSFWRTGIAITGHEVTDTLQSKRRFFGLDLLLLRRPELYQRGAFCRELALATGSGFSDKEQNRFWRWKLDFSAGMHVPFLERHALAARFKTQNITTDIKDTLHSVEKFRTGGQSSLRGYAENQFSFMTTAYVQLEYLYYYGSAGSAYIFMDGGAGFSDRIGLSRDSRTELLGYGIGLRIPIKVGIASIAWARNIEDTRSLGRIHVRIQNMLASESPW